MEALEAREMPSVTAVLNGDTLSVTGDAARDRVTIRNDAGTLIVTETNCEIARFNAASVARIEVQTGGGADRVIFADSVTQPATIGTGDGNDKIKGGSGNDTINGGAGVDLLLGQGGTNQLNGGAGADKLPRVGFTDTTDGDTTDFLVNAVPDLAALTAMTGATGETLTPEEVDTILKRATAASSSNDGIFAVVDRNGRVLGVRVENGVSSILQSNDALLTFAIDGALAKARTAAFFASNQAPLTSRTIFDLSQSTVTEREVNSNPSITDPNSTARGPGFVAAVTPGGHFPQNIALTPPVDLFGIEHTNRDSIMNIGPDRIKGTADDILLPGRFNTNEAAMPGQQLFPPESYGLVSGIAPGAQARGIATLPGGIPIYKNGQLVGGIGVFFPGQTGFATAENSITSTTYDATKPDRSFEAEYIAFAAVGGSPSAGLAIGQLGNAPPLPAGFGLPSGRIDLVGITLDVFGPGGNQGPERLTAFGQGLGIGNANAARNVPVTTGADGVANTGDEDTLIAGLPAPEGFLVAPRDGVGITAAEVTQIITSGFAQAAKTRAAIRLPLSTATAMVFAVADQEGNIVGLYHMKDATIFSIDVAVAKARNVMYYADPNQLQPIDQVPGVPVGTQLSNRTFRYLALPRFPSAIDLTQPAPFSQYNDGGVDPLTARQVGAPLPASAYQSVFGYDGFNPGTNFRQQGNILNQNGIVFFPGSAPLYRNNINSATLIGGFGVSGDGVDQDDVVTIAGAAAFTTGYVLRADQTFFNGVRLPYQKMNRNPEGGSLTNQ